MAAFAISAALERDGRRHHSHEPGNSEPMKHHSPDNSEVASGDSKRRSKDGKPSDGASASVSGVATSSTNAVVSAGTGAGMPTGVSAPKGVTGDSEIEVAADSGGNNDRDFERKEMRFTVKEVRDCLHLLMEEPDSSRAARYVSQFILVTIVVSLACFILATVPSIRKFPVWDWVEAVTTIIFTIEYLLRFAVSDVVCERCRGKRPQTRCDFIKRPMNLLDLFAIMPFYVEKAMEKVDSVKTLRVLRAVRLIRCFRVFKLSKLSQGMNFLLIESLANSVRPLAVLTFFLCIGMVLFSSLVYFAERSSCPDVKAMQEDGRWQRYVEECSDGAGETRDGLLCCNEYGSAEGFDSIASAFWWSIVTMTTVGYGDRAPRTALGMLVACVAMVSGIVLISLPVAIVGSKFQQAYDDYEFEQQRKLLIERELKDPSEEEPQSSNMVRQESGKKNMSQVMNAVAALSEMKPVAVERAMGQVSGGDDEVLPAYARTDSKAWRRREELPHVKLFEKLVPKLKRLEDNKQLNKDAHAQVELLLELFEHIERVEKELTLLRDKDAALDVCIRQEFLALTKAHAAQQHSHQD